VSDKHGARRFDQGLAAIARQHLKAPCFALSELKAENLYHAVRQEMVALKIGGARDCLKRASAVQVCLAKIVDRFVRPDHPRSTNAQPLQEHS